MIINYKRLSPHAARGFTGLISNVRSKTTMAFSTQKKTIHNVFLIFYVHPSQGALGSQNKSYQYRAHLRGDILKTLIMRRKSFTL
jgi:hypothetical protein